MNVKRHFALVVAGFALVAVDGAVAGRLDSLLADQHRRAGDYAVAWWAPLEKGGLTAEEAADYRFLLANLPLADLAMATPADLVENVRLAREAREQFSWGHIYGEDLYRHFVLPHRVSQEPFVPGWRARFRDELAGRVASLGMTAAALEVNLWCLEKATFKQTDARDQDALTTIRSGFGRCEEEMILAICALRSVGIPARQCFTPYWAHQDNNHAWVEFWADGAWHYFGACEPEAQPDRAWFTPAAARAMVVVSQVFGDYDGPEPVLRRYGRSTLLNSTGVYGTARRLRLVVLDHKGRPARGVWVTFGLFNYGGIMPALRLQTDRRGVIELDCGRGDWLVTAATQRGFVLERIPGDLDSAVIQMRRRRGLPPEMMMPYRPPPEPASGEAAGRDSAFACRLDNANRTREEVVWDEWLRSPELGVLPPKSPPTAGLKPDTLLAAPLAAKLGVKPAEVADKLLAARGNWGVIYRFMAGVWPPDTLFPEFRAAERQKACYLLLNSLSEKDLRDATLEALEDHLWYSTLGLPLATDSAAGTIEAMPDDRRERYLGAVVTPRLNYEPNVAWREALYDFFFLNPDMVTPKGDRNLLKYIEKHFVLERETDRLGPPLDPASCFKLKRGTRGDLERLYAGMCRVRGIPARFEDASGRLQVWRDGDWRVPKMPWTERMEPSGPDGTLRVTAAEGDTGVVGALYMRDWCVERKGEGWLAAVDMGYQRRWADMEWPRRLPEGVYCLTYGRRVADGSARVAVRWFEIRSGKETTVKLSAPPLEP